MPDNQVKIHCTALPDGFWSKSKPRLSLVLTPHERDGIPGTSVDVEHWPQHISNAKLVIALGKRGADGSVDYKYLTAGFKVDESLKANIKDADKLWWEIFKSPAGAFDALMRALRENHEPPKPAVGAALTTETTREDIKKLFDDNPIQIHRHRIRVLSANWVQASYLDGLLNAVHDNALVLRLSALLIAHNMRLAARGLAAADHRSLAASLGESATTILGSEGAQWMTSIGTSFANRPFRERLLAGVQDGVLRQLLENGLGQPPADAFGRLQRRAPSASLADGKEGKATSLADDQAAVIREVILNAVSRPPPRSERPEDPANFVRGRADAQATVRAFFAEAARRQINGPDLSMLATTKLAGLQTQVQKNFQAFHRHWQNSPVGARDNPAATAFAMEDAARRKFFGIRALPTLAKFLRLIVDVEMNPADLQGRDLVAAWFTNDANSTPETAKAEFRNSSIKPDVTAYEFAVANAGVADRSYFRPRAAGGDVADLAYAPPIKNGVVNLQATAAAGGARFGITVLDTATALNALRTKAEQGFGAERDGTLLDSVSTKMPERQARGLQLLDRESPHEMTADLVRARFVPEDSRPGSESRPLYAQDLVIGYRPYVQRWRHGESPAESNGKVTNPPPWRSLVARRITIPRVIETPSYRSLQTRDHGYIRTARKVQTGTDDSGDPTTDEQMFAWMGPSLALSTDVRTELPANEANDWPGQNPNTDLALDTQFSFSDEKLPALRERDGYIKGLTPVYPNGGGPTLDEASDAFNARGAETVVLGEENSKVVPFVFGPARDIPAPGILVSESEAAEWRKHDKPKSDKQVDRGRAEHVERLVLRTAKAPGDNKATVIRYLVPPRTTFERAEQAGMFDKVYEPNPAGAFSEYALDEEHGNFVAEGVPTRRPPNQPLPADQRPAVLRPVASPKQPRARYYPDPLARNLRIRFERSGAVPVGFPEDIPLRSFWAQDAEPKTARPLELLIRRWPEGNTGGRINFADDKGTVTGAASKVSRQVDRLALEIAQAEDVNLRIWCVPDAWQLLKSRKDLKPLFRSFAATLAAPTLAKGAFDAAVVDQYFDCLADGFSPQEAAKRVHAPANLAKVIDEAFAQVFSALLLQTPDNGLNGWMTLEVVHAVDKPLAIPAIPRAPRSKKIADGVPSEALVWAFHPVRLTRNTKWEDYAATLDPTHLLGALDLPSQPDGTTAYFVGQIEFNRPSTGELRVEASWPELDPAIAIVRKEKEIKEPKAKKKPIEYVYEYRPPRRDRPLFNSSVKVPRDRGIHPDGRLDLTFDETGLLRGLNFPFSDTAAREISLRIVATSRFVNDFPPEADAKTPEKDALGKFEEESRPPTGSKRLEAAPKESYCEYKIMVPASAAPALPTIQRLEWVMPERLTAFERGRRICVEKQFYPRLYLGRDWFGSGEHELFAVVCAPGNLVSDRDYSTEVDSPSVLDPIALSAAETKRAPEQRAILASDFTVGKYSALADKVSLWGADPTTRSTALTGAITRERFSGFVASKSKVPLPSDSSQKVSLLLYKVQFDPACGEFYVDIGIDPGPAHAPIIQLAVARYQPYVIDERFHLSNIALARPFQVAPKRTVEVLIHEARHVRTIVQGVGYTNRAPEVPKSFKPSPDKQPVLTPEYASIFQYPLQNVRVISLGHTASGVQVHNEKGKPLLTSRVAPQFFHPQLIWISEFHLPVPCTKHHYGLEFDEIDLHFADEAYEDGAGIGDGIVERPSKFSLTVDLDSGLYEPGAVKAAS